LVLNKFIVAIPAYNEEKSIGHTISLIRKSIPKALPVSIIIIDDGSNDRTVDVAKTAGADVIIQHSTNYGVGIAYRTALDYAVQIGADIICTIDADMQFDPGEILELVEPIRNGVADLVIGSRFLGPNNNRKIPVFNLIGNNLMARFLSFIIGQRLYDVESGYRAISVKAAKELNLIGIGSFTQDMLLELSNKGYPISEVPISVKYYNGRSSRVIGRFIKYGFRSLCIVILKKISLHWDIQIKRMKKARAKIIYEAPDRVLTGPVRASR
jgi:glycosyltransferase involved in cell wall biosynthesis